MGFSSFKCAKSNHSIPAWPYAELPQEASDIVALFSDGTIVRGTYGGYGNFEPGRTVEGAGEEATIGGYIYRKCYKLDDSGDLRAFQRHCIIVRADHYNEAKDTFQALRVAGYVSNDCRAQGFFYDDSERETILASLPGEV
jgi:hypothetical protein